MNELLRISAQQVIHAKREAMEALSEVAPLSYMGIQEWEGQTYMCFSGGGRLFLEDNETAYRYEVKQNKQDITKIVLHRLKG